MQQAVRITLRLPIKLHDRLKKRAQEENRSLNKIIVDTLQQELSSEVEYPQSDRERALQAIRESGFWEPLGPEWLADIDKSDLLSHEELRELLKDVPPLSDIIIEDRGPR